MKRHLLTLTAMALMGASTVLGQTLPTMDGTREAAFYGAALSLQNTDTQFGDANNGDPVNGGGGSEIDGVYARVGSDNRLYVMITGNLETNFNKLELFFDSVAGKGVNTIDGGVQPKMVDGYSKKVTNNDLPNLPDPNSGALQQMNSLQFDTGFNADYYLAINHGFEGNIDGTGSGTQGGLRLYAASAHFAQLADPSNSITGVGQALGVQYAQRGLPQVLRGTTSDVDIDGDADGADFLLWQRNYGAAGVNRKSGDVSGNGSVGDEDFTEWKGAFGFNVASATFDANFFAPQSTTIDNSNVLLGPALPGLTQGQLIDKTYAAAHPGLTPELNIVLPIAAGDEAENLKNRRDMQNTIDLRMAIDNSNIAGVVGGGGPTAVDQAALAAVATGVEFSIPLSALGNLAGTGIKITAFVNGGNHGFISNQVSGTGVLQGNIGGIMPGFGDEEISGFFLGNQFVTVPNPALPAATTVPEPATAGLIAVGLLAGALRRRR